MSTIKGRYVKVEPKGKSERSVNVHTEIYDSTSEFAADLKSRRRRIQDDYHGYNDVRTDTYSGHFQGVGSYDEAMDLLQHGYMPLVDQVKASMKKLKLTTNNRAFRNSMVGFAPIVPNAIKGLPISMVDNINDGTKNKVFDIYYDLAINAGTSASDLLIRGKALLEALMTLELKGYRFNLYCAQSTTDRRNLSIVDILAIKVKNSDTPLNLIRVAFPLVHPAFFRVFGFDWMDKSPVTRMLGHGRGSPLCRILDRESIDTIYKAMFGYNAIYLSSDDVKDVIDSAPALDGYIIELANDESCPRDPTTYSESINFRDLIEKAYEEERGSGPLFEPMIEAMRRIGFSDPDPYPHIEYRTNTGENLLGTSPRPMRPPNVWQSPFDMTENELEKELRKHINELREAHRRGRL